MRKRNFTQHQKNIKVRFQLDDKIEKSGKKDDLDILYSFNRKNPKLGKNNVSEEKRNYTVDEKEIDNLYELKEEKNEDKKIKEEDDEDEYFAQPLLMVHRMSMKKKEMGKIRNTLKKNIKKPEALETVAINKEKAQQMAQNFFKKKLKYFTHLKCNTESDISDALSSKPKREINNTLPNTLEIKTDSLKDKSNSINKRKIENSKNFGLFKLKKKRFERLPTDIFQNRDIKMKINLEPKEEEKKEETKEETKEKNKNIIIPRKEEKKIIENKNNEKKERKEVPMKEEENNNKKEIIIEDKKIIKAEEPPKKEISFRRKFRLSLDKIGDNSYSNINKNKNVENNKNNRVVIAPLNLTNLTDKNSGGRKKFNFPKPVNNINNKEINTETNNKEEKENLTSRTRGFRRKYFLNKENEEDSKLVYKSIIRVNKRIEKKENNKKEEKENNKIEKKENNKIEEKRKEPIENKYKKFREMKGQSQTEDKIKTKYGKDVKIDNEKDLKTEKIDKIKENTNTNVITVNRGPKISTRNFYKRRIIKKD